MKDTCHDCGERHNLSASGLCAACQAAEAASVDAWADREGERLRVAGFKYASDAARARRDEWIASNKQGRG